MIAKGHCQAWILMAWCADAAILSDTYTFSAGMEYQGQNVGTEIATEELCRKLTGFRTGALTDSVKIWCGTFGSAQVYNAPKEFQSRYQHIIIKCFLTGISIRAKTFCGVTGCRMRRWKRKIN